MQSLPPVIEDSLYVSANYQRIGERTARQSVLHVVRRQRAAVLLLEHVLVHPTAVGAFDLAVNEAVRRFPGQDFGAPAQRKAPVPQPIVNAGAGRNFNWLRRVRICEVAARAA